MGTLLYNPGVKIAIASSASNQIIDVSDDIKSGSLTLNENDPHSLNFTLANPGGKYASVFTPNDRVVVQLKRLTWLQVFAGYLNTVPLFSVYPSDVSLNASCTMKELIYHFWDPGYADVISWVGLAFNNAFGSPGSNLPSAQAIQNNTNAGMTALLTQIMTQIIGWDKSRIHIGGIPSDWLTKLDPIWNEVAGQALGAAAATGPSASVGGVSVGSGNTWTSSAWASTVLSLVGCPATANNITNLLHWMANENPADNWFNRCNPLNASLNTGTIDGTGSYPDLYTGALNTANMLSNIPGNIDYYAAIRNAFNSNVDTVTLAQAVISTPWASGHYNNDPVGFASSTIDGTVVAPANDGTIPSSASFLNQTTPTTSNNATTSSTGGAYGTGTAGALSGTGAAATPPGVAPNNGATPVTNIDQVPGAATAAAWALANVGPPNPTADCSAFTQAAYNAAGISIPRTSEAQYNDPNVVLIDVSLIQPGDLLFGHFGFFSPPGHVAMFVGGPNNTVVQNDPAATGTLSGWIAAAEAESTQVPGGGFYGVGRVTQTAESAAKDNQPVTFSSSAINSVQANGLGTASGNLLYGSGAWNPGAATPDSTAGDYTGAKLLMQDQGIMPFISSVVFASLRSYCSAPNGDFIAWFPDYFGQYGYAGVMHVSTVELLDFNISWSDSNLITHQFVAGMSNTANATLDPTNSGSSDAAPWQTFGVATIDLPGLLDALIDTGANAGTIFSSPDLIYEQFGARPNFQSMPTVAAHTVAEFWFAVRMFQYNWAKQFSANVSLTFMPELWPGMLLAIDDLGFQAYIHQVSHSWNMDDNGGFSTTVNVIAPSSLANGGLVGLPRAGGPGPISPSDSTPTQIGSQTGSSSS